MPRFILPQQRAVGYFERPNRLLKRRRERAVNRHHLAGGFHLRADAPVAARELVEGPARNLDHAVIQRRLERGERPLRDGVRDFVEPFADGDFGGDARNRIARRLRRERRAAADARVDLYYIVGAFGAPAVGERLRDDLARLQRHLNVAAALNAERADYLQTRRAQQLIFLVAKRLAGRDHDAVARVDAHRVYVLHVADSDAVVRAVAHHFVLDFFPADERLFDENLPNRARGDAALDNADELRFGLRDAAARAAERVRRADDERQPDVVHDAARVLDRLDDGGRRDGFADFDEQVAEQLAVFGAADGVERRAEQPDAVSVENAGVGELDGEIQPRLPAERGQNAVRRLPRDDALQRLDRERLDIDHVGDVFVRHNRGGIGVDEDGDDALFAQRLASLRPRVIELRRLPDDDRPGADD